MKKAVNFLNGKKTYIVVGVAIVFNTLVTLGYLQPDHIQYVNIVLGALGLAALRSGINNQ